MFGQIYSDKLILFSGDDSIDFYYFGVGYTSGDSIVVFRVLWVVHIGDFFVWKGVLYIDVNNGGSGVSYLEMLEVAANGIFGVDMVIFGYSLVMIWDDFCEFGDFNCDFLSAVQ